MAIILYILITKDMLRLPRLLSRSATSRSFASSISTVVVSADGPTSAKEIERGCKALENNGKVLATSGLFVHSSSRTCLAAIKFDSKHPGMLQSTVAQISAANPAAHLTSSIHPSQIPVDTILELHHRFADSVFKKRIDGTGEFTQIVPLLGGRMSIPVGDDTRMLWLNVRGPYRSGNLEAMMRSSQNAVFKCVDELAADKSAQIIVINDTAQNVKPYTRYGEENAANVKLLLDVLVARKDEFVGRALGLCTGNSDFAFHAIAELGLDMIYDPFATAQSYNMLEVMGRTGGVYVCCYPLARSKLYVENHGQASLKDDVTGFFDDLLAKAYAKRMYKWNMLFDYESLAKSNLGQLKELVGQLAGQGMYLPMIHNLDTYKEPGSYIRKIIKTLSL